MEQTDKMENYPHLTTRKGSGDYGLYASVTTLEAPVISKALVNERAETGEPIARIVKRRILEPRAENEARQRVALALEYADMADPHLVTWDVIVCIRKALTGCPTDTNTVFTGRSEEYEERYGDEG